MSNWPKVTLDEVCDIRIGRTPRRNQQKYWGGENIWLSIADLKTDVISDSSECITDVAVEEAMPDPVPAGTLLFSFKLTIGRMAFAGVPLYTNEAIAAFIVKDVKRLDKRYLKYILSVTAHSTEASHAAKGKTLNKQKLRRIEIPLPPIEVQEKIVSKLDRASQLKKKREEADKKMAAFAPALFHQMFGDPGKNEKGWEVKKLGEVCRFVGGGTPSKSNPDYWSGDIPWVSPKDMACENIEDAQDHITKQAIAESATSLLPIGAILIVTRSGILKHTMPIAITQKPAAINQDIKGLLIKDNESVATLFVYQQLVNRNAEILATVKPGVTVQSIDTDSLKDLFVIVPPYGLQKEFASRVSNTNKLRVKQSVGRKKLEGVFDGLLNSIL